MPFAGAASQLAAAFGISLLNGVVEDPARLDPVVFRRADGSLVAHPITRGREAADQVDSVGTFDGAAFRAEDAEPLLVLSAAYVSYQWRKAWAIDKNTPNMSVAGWLQGAVKRVREGRLAVFSDATMFSAQIAPDRSRLGMNTPEGRQNLRLLRNVMHLADGAVIRAIGRSWA